MNRLFKLLTLVLTLALSSCTKPGDTPPTGNPPPGGTPTPPVGTPPDYTQTPASTPVTGGLVVYNIGNNQSTNPYYVELNPGLLNYNSTYNAFRSSSIITMDKYAGLVSYRPALTTMGYTPVKTFIASAALKTYVNVKLIPQPSAGYVSYSYGSGTLNLPGGGKLVLPPYSFGLHSGPVTFDVYTGYTNPSLADYALMLPCYPMADENGKRWFLNSYGMYMLSPHVSDIDGYNVDFDPKVDVLLKMPVPANLSSPPDSIPVYNINSSNLWQRNGYANKVGDYYQKKITKKGFWNFAIPVNGVYTTFHLKTKNGYGLANVRYLVKNKTDEIAEGRTDANGDGTVFVPTNTDLTVDVINDFTLANNVKIPGLPLGNFNQASEVTVSLPSRKDIYTLQGNVFDCDGKPVQSGYAAIRTTPGMDQFVYPIKDGKFSAAQWLGGPYSLPANVTLYNSNGDSLINHPFIVRSQFGTSFVYNANFYTCYNTQLLYCNYIIDSTTSYSINGNISSASPELYSQADRYETRVNLVDNGKGLRFNFWTATTGESFVSITRPEVNGTPVTIDNTPTYSEIRLYRNDAKVGGIMEGWFYVYYKESNGSLHTITGNFRIKIT